jgi:hypothetical protein
MMKRKLLPATAYRLMTAEEYALAVALRESCLTRRVHILKWLFVKSMSDHSRRALTEKQAGYLRQMASWQGVSEKLHLTCGRVESESAMRSARGR